MAAIDSLSSCAPQAKAQPPPPIAHAPTPMGVNSMSLLPRRFFCIFSTIAKVAGIREEKRRSHRLRSERTGGGDLAGAGGLWRAGPRGRGFDRRRCAIGRADAPGFRARRVLLRVPDGSGVAVFRTVPARREWPPLGPSRCAAGASAG